MYIKYEYGGGDESDPDVAFDNVGDWFEAAGSIVQDAATSVEDGSEAITRWRSETLPKLNDLLEEVGGYATSKVSDEGYVGTLAGYSIEQAENAFESEGFQLNLVAAYKYAPNSNLYNASDGSYRLKDHSTADYQIHVTLFEWYNSNFNRMETDVYAHAEAGPLAHPMDHYNAQPHDPGLGVKIVKDIMPQWDYDYWGYNGSIDEACGGYFGYPYY